MDQGLCPAHSGLEAQLAAMAATLVEIRDDLRARDPSAELDRLRAFDAELAKELAVAKERADGEVTAKDLALKTLQASQANNNEWQTTFRDLATHYINEDRLQSELGPIRVLLDGLREARTTQTGGSLALAKAWGIALGFVAMAAGLVTVWIKLADLAGK